ncbi:hypothetical protein WN944_014455 [Citrus x changshan-huyou]|uniref:Uncharacterized protein n=1 Tax=Citrus x changshan-huyou TaxID=2935761 RepID=A0AAP0QQ36_9ROSI
MVAWEDFCTSSVFKRQTSVAQKHLVRYRSRLRVARILGNRLLSLKLLATLLLEFWAMGARCPNFQQHKMAKKLWAKRDPPDLKRELEDKKKPPVDDEYEMHNQPLIYDEYEIDDSHEKESLYGDPNDDNLQILKEAPPDIRKFGRLYLRTSYVFKSPYFQTYKRVKKIKSLPAIEPISRDRRKDKCGYKST